MHTTHLYSPSAAHTLLTAVPHTSMHAHTQLPPARMLQAYPAADSKLPAATTLLHLPSYLPLFLHGWTKHHSQSVHPKDPPWPCYLYFLPHLHLTYLFFVNQVLMNYTLNSCAGISHSTEINAASSYRSLSVQCLRLTVLGRKKGCWR